MKKYMMTTVASMFLIGVGFSNSAYAIENKKVVTSSVASLTTKEEIMAFQKANGLKADGIIGPKTKAALQRLNDAVISTSTAMQRPDDIPSTPKKPARKIAAVVPDNKNPFKKCQFLFWEVDCVNNDTEDKVISNVKISTATPHLKKGLEMVGMNARKDKKELANLFEKNLGQRVDPTRIPWCAAWTNMVLAETGVEGTDSLMARSFLNWGHAIREPKQGDIVVLRRGRNKFAGHVGFFIQTVEVNGQRYIAVLGGNQSKGVSIAYYPESKVIGYRTAA
jgi:uncharacterized protein (TIGR02594 family)